MNSPAHVCNYALLRYLPYPDTGEFVNVGIVIHDAAQGWCAHAGDGHDIRRVTQFFPQVTELVYERQRRAIFEELERVTALVRATADRRLARQIFQELVRPRESVFRFGEIRTAMTDDPAVLLRELSEQYLQPRGQKASWQPFEQAF